MIDEPNDRFHTPWYDDSGTRRRAIIPHKPRWLLARVDLLRERLDIKFVVPNFLVCNGIENFPTFNFINLNPHFSLPGKVRTHCFTCAKGGIGNVAEYNVYAGLSEPPFRCAGTLAGSSSTI